MIRRLKIEGNISMPSFFFKRILAIGFNRACKHKPTFSS